MTAEASRNKQVVRDLTEAIWNRCELERIPEFYSAEYVADFRPLAPPRTGHAGIRGMVERAWEAFTDYREELQEVVAEGPLVVAQFTVTGIHTGTWGQLPPTNRAVSFKEAAFLQLRGGLVIRQTGISDNLTALRQLGFLPGGKAEEGAG